MRKIVPAFASRLDTSEPLALQPRLAAVSVIVDGEVTPSILLIKRAERTGDPWSGQVAFPGGKMTEEDGSVLRTASRETMEEVGIDLDRDASFLGYFGSFRTHTGAMNVVPAVFMLKRRVKVVPNKEVSDYRWVALGSFLSPAKTASRSETNLVQARGPAFVVGDFVVWGLTHRMIKALLGRLRS